MLSGSFFSRENGLQHFYYLNQIEEHHTNNGALLTETLMQRTISSPATIISESTRVEEMGPAVPAPFT